MWIGKEVWLAWNKELAEARAEARIQLEGNKVLQVNMDWLRVRINQLEHERAVLIENYMGVKVSPPRLSSPDDAKAFNDPAQFDPFADIGDKEAERMGIGFNLDGSIAYRE